VIEYRVIYEFDKETGQVTATVPDLNYVSSFVADFAEAERNIQEAVEAYLEALVKEGQSLPLVAEGREGTFLHIRDISSAAVGSKA